MRKSRDFLSLPVVSLEEGREIGRVRSLVINPSTGEVAALMVQSRGLFGEQKAIPYQRVVSAGSNALTVQKASSAEKLASLPQILNLIKEAVHLKGARVITEGGTVLGVVEEFLIDPATGKIAALEIAGRLNDKILKRRAILPASEVRTIGRDVVVVHNGAEEALTPGESPLAEGIKNLKEGANRILRKAWQGRQSPEGGADQPAPPQETPGEAPSDGDADQKA
ncbi:MAG: PRC-barrel domain-containing protein [Thermacetogeniaceae bacterium]